MFKPKLSELSKLMHRKERIRNVGIIAHIDHGKTTLTDALLAGAGLLPSDLAGAARVLDYLEEEQRRGITIKAACASMVYHTAEGLYLVNLVDTPGHVDFTGKVTRALRIIDGAIVVVDAVEEIMPQTETVIRQALEERVRPVLLINKADRLINELKLSAKEVYTKTTRIISKFNDLIEVYAEPKLGKEWKVTAVADNVVFGSALHNWGFTLHQAQTSGIKLSRIIEVYKTKEFEKLKKMFPLHLAVLCSIVKCLPNPAEAQKYRIEKIWRGNMDSEVGHALTSCSDEGPVVFFVANFVQEPNGFRTATGRLFSGTLKTGSRLRRFSTANETEAKQVAVWLGAAKQPVNQANAGNILAVSVMEDVKVGETLVTPEHATSTTPFEELKYVSEPVLTFAVEPRNPKDLPLLLSALHALQEEDPNLSIIINTETGEYLMSGMGELHLEVALKELQRRIVNAELAVSPPRVVYMESITRKSSAVTAASPNRQNRFTLQVEPAFDAAPSMKYASTTTLIVVSDQHGNSLCDCTGISAEAKEVSEALATGFTFACKSGPLSGSPLRNVKAWLLQAQLSTQVEQRQPEELARGLAKALYGAILMDKPVLMEPVYKLTLTTPPEMSGLCIELLGARRGKILSFEEKGALTVITCQIPVAESLELAQRIRTATSGRAFWQSTFSHWEKTPMELASEIIGKIRRQKGLPPKPPSAERFIEKSAPATENTR